MIHVRQALENMLCQRASTREDDFTNSFLIGFGPPSTSDRTVIPFIGAVKDLPAQEEHDVAQLIVRNVDPEVVHRLKLRAAQHGRSMEAEHREILRQALLASEPGVTLKALLLAMPPVGDDTDFARLPDQGREVEL
jgi:antitoxin FitA